MFFAELLDRFGETFWISLLVSGLGAYPIYRLLLALNSRQTVSEFAPEGHQAKQGTPTMGGLICLVGLLAALAWRSIDPLSVQATGLTLNSFSAALLLVLGFAFIGFVDDFVVPRFFKGKRGLGWKQKIVGQFLFSLVAVRALGLEPTPLNFAVCAFVVLFFANAFNFVDGLDGLAGSVGILMFLGFAGLAAVYNQPGITVAIGGLVVGSLIPFLCFNAPPARVFMGDVGSLPIGALGGICFLDLGIRWFHGSPFGTVTSSPGRLAVLVGLRSPAILIPLSILSLVMFVELVPVPLQILSVKLRKKRLFPFTPIHHAFEKAGWPESQVVWTFALVQALCVAFALLAATELVGSQTFHGAKNHYYYLSPASGR